MYFKKAVIVSIAGVVLFSGGAAYAAGEKTSKPETHTPSATHVKKTLTPEEQKQKLLDTAKKMGIDAQGKSDSEIKALINEKMVESAKNKRAAMEKRLQEEAAKLGIDPSGKSGKQLAAEIHKKQKENKDQKNAALLQKLRGEAVKLGIAADGKSAKELMQAIKAKHKELGAQKNGKK